MAYKARCKHCPWSCRSDGAHYLQRAAEAHVEVAAVPGSNQQHEVKIRGKVDSGNR